jgi:hypothetical protein
MRKPLPLTLLRVINPCHLHDPNGMSQPDDTNKTLSKHGGSLCQIPPCLRVDDLSSKTNNSGARQKSSAQHCSVTFHLSRHTLATPTVVNSCRSLRGKQFRWSQPQHRIEVNRSRLPGTGDLVDLEVPTFRWTASPVARKRPRYE